MIESLLNFNSGVFRLIAITSAVIMLLGCGSKQSDIDRELLVNQAQFAPLLASIENYRIAHGQYPRTLSDLGNFDIPQIISSKKFKSFRARQLTYEVGRDLTFFRVSYSLDDADDYEVLGFSIYLSLEPQWLITTYIPRLPHVEAEYYGAAYVASRSREKLDLAVQSLLSAAHLSSDYPCRNLWHDWIVESLGQGDSKQAVPSIGSKELIAYADEQERPAYAFAISEVFSGSRSKPLKIVTDLYQMTSESTEWKLVQTCDTSAR